MYRPSARLCSLTLMALLCGTGHAQTADLVALLVSGESLVTLDTDGSGTVSDGDSSYETFYNVEEDCFVVLGNGDFEDPGDGSTTFLFRATETDSGWEFEEISSCGDYIDSREETYTASVESSSTAKQNGMRGFDNVLIRRPPPGDPNGERRPVGSGQLRDSDGDGMLDAVEGDLSNGMPMSMLVDMRLHPGSDNPTHLKIPARLRRGDGERGFYDAFIPLTADRTVTVVRADDGTPIGGLGEMDGVTIGELPRGVTPAALAIPTVSRWGMMVLTLVLLGVAVNVMRRLQY